jgi:hypothetical protein
MVVVLAVLVQVVIIPEVAAIMVAVLVVTFPIPHRQHAPVVLKLGLFGPET